MEYSFFLLLLIHLSPLIEGYRTESINHFPEEGDKVSFSCIEDTQEVRDEVSSIEGILPHSIHPLLLLSPLFEWVCVSLSHRKEGNKSN